MKYPHIPLYTGDWMKDTELSLCKPATRGVWIDLICAMHERNRSGELRGTSEQLSRLARCSTVELEAAFTDLQTTGAALVEHRNDIWTIANRRMKREYGIREKRAQAGSIGGSKTQAKREQTPDTDNDNGLERVREFSKGEGISESDADWFYWKGKGNGWTNGGKPIMDWKATLRCWSKAGWLPSQKNGSNGRVVRSMSAFEIKERVTAITAEINSKFKAQGGRVEGDGIDELKQRRDELQKQLIA